MASTSPLPDLIIIGAMKSGTSTLYDQLRRSSGTQVTWSREPEVLLRQNRQDALDAYAAEFKGRQGGSRIAVRAERSTAYAKRPLVNGVAERAFEWLGPETKILYLVRDPIDRMVSQVKHHMATGVIPNLPWPAVLAEFPQVVSFSRYEYQLEPWFHFFEDTVRVVSFDDLIREPIATLTALGSFIGDQTLADRVGDDLAHVNAASEIRRARPIVGKLKGSVVYNRWVRPRVPTRLRTQLSSLSGQVQAIPSVDFDKSEYPELVAQLAEEYRSILNHPSRLRPA